MIISVVSPHNTNNGNTVTSLLLAHGLADLKRKVFLTHVKPASPAFALYLGLHDFDDKTSTPTQLVKLMREGAVKAEDISDYCKNVDDFLDVFTNNQSNFSSEDMSTLHDFIIESENSYEYTVFDIDADREDPATLNVLKKSQIIILNVGDSYADLDKFNAHKDKIIKMCAGKTVILACSAYDSKAIKLKDITKRLGMSTNCHPIRVNSWLKWGINNGKLSYVFTQGKMKDGDVIEVYKDATALASTVAKTKIAINKKAKGVFKRD